MDLAKMRRSYKDHKWLAYWRFGLMGLAAWSMVACMTPAEKRQMKDDLSRLQARMIEAENMLTEQGQDLSRRSNRHAAGANTRLDGIERKIQQLRGEIDTLRVGVITGQMPGINAENEGSVARSLEVLQERVKELEEAQERVLKAIDQATNTGQQQAPARNRQVEITTLRELQRAFDDQRFRHVAENGAAVLRSQTSAPNKEQALFLFAESLYKLGRLKDAALKFNDFLEMKPRRNVAHAKMRMGDCFRHLGDIATARIYYEELISSYASSSEAKTAEERLAQLDD